jgi:hypothetical protein
VRRVLAVNMGDLNAPAGAVRCSAKGETEGCIKGVKKSEGAVVPKKRVITVEGSAPVTNNRKGETGWSPHSKGAIKSCEQN